MQSLLRCGWLLALLALVVPGESQAGTWKIGRNQQDCPGGCSFYDGHPQVQFNGGGITAAMLSASVVAGDTVRVWPGTYNQRFTMKSSIVLVSDQGPATTILAGAAGQEPLCLMVNTGPLTTIDGFTIRWDAQTTGTGGGIGAYVASGTIRNNIFRNCQAALGSGAYMQFCDLTVENNLFVNNTCHSGGGVLAVAGGTPTIRNNTLVGSIAPLGLHGAAVFASGASMTFENNIITGSVGGTAVYCANMGGGTFGCNDVWGNLDGAFGGSCVDSVGASGNVSLDPLFCNPGASDYGMCVDSPAVTGPCGVIGYQPTTGNCPACFPTPVAELEFLSWGKVKSRYR
ncbi:MAG: hypothetical protein DHS20C21_06510 [Gemmatimonadota bacterium]|nr:MAG: hypothetical protein DHS20C21_06510 [Gemmatimonadota bacterium]